MSQSVMITNMQSRLWFWNFCKYICHTELACEAGSRTEQSECVSGSIKD